MCMMGILPGVQVRRKDCPTQKRVKWVIRVAMAGCPGKGYRLRLLYRQKYTMKLTLCYRFCQVTHRNNSLRG
jgi:hypothetical protein